jgi:hypothetical protein
MHTTHRAEAQWEKLRAHSYASYIHTFTNGGRGEGGGYETIYRTELTFLISRSDDVSKLVI